jgi:hypothetical protein
MARYLTSATVSFPWRIMRFKVHISPTRCGSPRTCISVTSSTDQQFGVDVIRGVGFVVRLDERTSRESLWLVTGRLAAARVEDLGTFFASPLKGALGLAVAVLVRPGWSILVGGCARQAQSKSARARRAGLLWSALVVTHGWAGAGAWRAAMWPLSSWPCTRPRGKSVSGLVP